MGADVLMAMVAKVADEVCFDDTEREDFIEPFRELALACEIEGVFDGVDQEDTEALVYVMLMAAAADSDPTLGTAAGFGSLRENFVPRLRPVWDKLTIAMFAEPVES